MFLYNSWFKRLSNTVHRIINKFVLVLLASVNRDTGIVDVCCSVVMDTSLHRLYECNVGLGRKRGLLHSLGLLHTLHIVPERWQFLLRNMLTKTYVNMYKIFLTEFETYSTVELLYSGHHWGNENLSFIEGWPLS